MKLPISSVSLYLLLFSGLLAGCRSEKATFYFRPPHAQAVPRVPAPPEQAAPAPPAPAVADKPVAPVLPLPVAARPAQRPRSAAPARAKRLAQLPLLQPVRVSRLLAARLARPATEHARATSLSNGARMGLILLGTGILLLLLVALFVTGIGTIEGVLLLLMGYAFAVALIISGLVMLLVTAISA